MPDARTPMLSAEEAASRAAEVGVPAALADLHVFRTLLRRPRPAKAVNDLLLSLLFGGTLDDRLRELVIMRIGWVTRSNYEWTQHWTVAQETFGCTADDLLAVRDWEQAAHFGAPERAVLRAVDETLADGAVSSSTIEACRTALGSDDAVVELVLAIGCWRAVPQIARSLDIPLEDGAEDWPPDGVAGAS